MNYMTCQTCRSTVTLNNIGICLGCQRGFIGIPQEDEYGQISAKNKDTANKMAELLARKEEIEYALEERKEQEDHQRKYQGVDRLGENSETSYCHKPKRGRKCKKNTEE